MIDLRPLDLLHAELATLLPLFRDVQLVTLPGEDGLPAGGNAVLLASDRRLPDDVASQADGAVGYDREAIVAIAARGRRLRDDYAPVDQLLTTP
jgi:hypothetical protein